MSDRNKGKTMLRSVLEVYSDIAKSHPPWTAKEEREFIQSCTTKTGKWRSNAMKDRFVNEAMKHNLGLVFKLVNKLAFNKTEDVFQKAMIGMVEALKKYDPKRRGKISTWINNPIRWAIMQHQNTYSKSGTIAEEIASLNHKFKMKMSVTSIDTPIGDDDDSDTLGSIISEKNLAKNYVIDRGYRTLNEEHHERDISNAVQEMLAKLDGFLTKRELFVVYGAMQGRTQGDMAIDLHLSKVRVGQIQALAFTKIRNSRMAKKLKGLLKE